MKRLLASVLILVVAFGTTNGQVDVCADVTDPGYTLKCTSCTRGALCSNGAEAFDIMCDPLTEGCDEIGGSCGLHDALTTENCGCVDPTTPGAILLGNYIDPYSSGSDYVNCSSGTPVYMSCADGEIFSEEFSICQTLPSCQGLVTGSYPISGSCTNYYNCTPTPDNPSPDAVLGSCSQGQIFDFVLQGCSEEFACTTTGGSLVNPLKCNLFASCYIAGETEYHCCPQGQNFDSVTRGCVTGTGSCERSYLNICKEEFYENTYCKYCESMLEGDRYATYLNNDYPNTCTRKYFECVNVDGSLQAELRECPEDQIFFATSNLCETIQVHPECTGVIP